MKTRESGQYVSARPALQVAQRVRCGSRLLCASREDDTARCWCAGAIVLSEGCLSNPDTLSKCALLGRGTRTDTAEDRRRRAEERVREVVLRQDEIWTGGGAHILHEIAHNAAGSVKRYIPYTQL